MKKLLRIGIPVMVAVLMLVIGTGLVAAQSKDISAPIKSAIAYDQADGTCPQLCQGSCKGNGNCPYAGNCNGVCQGSQNGSCCSGTGVGSQTTSFQAGSCCGLGNGASNSTANQQPLRRSCCR